MKFDGFKSAAQNLFYSRDPKTDMRLGDLVNTASNTVLIAGYPDDEGINNNGGRTGAKDAPDRIRHFLYRMTPPLEGGELFDFSDIGNLLTDVSLNERHQVAQTHALKALNNEHKWIGIGGGHDYGFADGAALVEYAISQKQKPLVINFDAHLDVRPVQDKLNSGTPFYRLLEKYSEIDFIEVGIQSQCNSRQHFEWLKSRGGHVLLNDTILTSSDPAYITVLKFLEPWILKRRLTFLSVDIDMFSTSQAPGCSQSWPLGLQAHDFFKIFETLRARLDIRVLGLYEVSPPLDIADITSKLAAQIIYQYLKKN